MKIKDVKIGMKVIGNDVADEYYLYTKKGYIGTVEAVNDFYIYIRGDDDGKTFSVDPRAFDKYEKDEAVLKVYRTTNGYYVKYNGQIVAGSRCHPNDKFDEQFGLNLALRRFCKTLNDRTVVEERKDIKKIVCIDDFI